MNDEDRANAVGTTKQTEQYLLNYSFDNIFKILMVGLLAYNPTTNTMDRMQTGSDGGLKVSDAASSARYDLVSPVYYVGSAPVGSSEAATVWNVTKYDLTSNPYTGKVAAGIAWSGRAGATYV